MILLVIWPCYTYDSIWFDPWFNPVRLMIRPFPSNISTPFHQWIGSWFGLVRLMVQPCSTNYSTSSTHDSTLLDPLFELWFDPWLDRPMIRPTHDWTLFEPWFDPWFDSGLDPFRPMSRHMIRPMIRHSIQAMIWSIIRPCLTPDSTLFDQWFVRCSIRLKVLICDENRTPFVRVGRTMSWKLSPASWSILKFY